jgi:hypothetical protein
MKKLFLAAILGFILIFAQTGLADDKIIEGNTSVEVIDTADGRIIFTEDGYEVGRFTGTNFGIKATNPQADLQVGTNRPFTVENSRTYLRGSTGGWAIWHHVKGVSGTDLGGFGAFGINDDLVHLYAGDSYGNPTMVWKDRKVGINTMYPNAELTIEGALSFDEIVAPSSTAGYGKLYVKASDGLLYFKDDGGTEYGLTSGGGGNGLWSDDGAYYYPNNSSIVRIKDDMANMSWATPHSHAIQSQNQISMDYAVAPASNLQTAFSVQAEGKGTGTTAFRGVMGLYVVAKDRSDVVAANKGVLYGILAEVSPQVERGSTWPGDDTAALCLANGGSARATDALYVGHNSYIDDDFIGVFTVDANAYYGLRFAGDYAFGIDFVDGGPATFSQAAMRIPNNTHIKARNAADTADISMLTLTAGNTVNVGTSLHVNGNITATGSCCGGGGGGSLWTDAGTYYYPNNWSGLKVYDSGKLDMATSKWVYDDATVAYTPPAHGVAHHYNQKISNFALNDSSNHESTVIIEGKTSGSNAKNKVALMTLMEVDAGTNQPWSMNPFLKVGAGWSPVVNSWAQCVEIDVNNQCSDPQAFTTGLSVTGYSSVSPTVAMNISHLGVNWGSGMLISDVDTYGILFFDSAIKPAYHLKSNNNTLRFYGNTHVTGNITASGACCDYVFEDDYNLMPLDDLDKYIKENTKLPGITTKEGISMAELYEKTEEQALYILELHERLKALEAQLN